MAWHPPTPRDMLYSPDAIKTGPAIFLLLWCYDRVEQEGWVTISLEQAATDMGRPYGTIRDWWATLRQGSFFSVKESHGRSGWRVQFNPRWIDWRVMAHDYPTHADPRADLNRRDAQRGDLNDEEADSRIKARLERGDLSGEENTNTLQRGDLSGQDSSSLTNAHFERGDLSGERNVYGTHIYQKSGGVGEEISSTRARKKQPDELALALAELCAISPQLASGAQRDELNSLYSALQEAGAEIQHVKLFATWWTSDKNGVARLAAKQGRELEAPTPRQVRENWLKAHAPPKARAAPPAPPPRERIEPPSRETIRKLLDERGINVQHNTPI